jgi:hypothetical protein
MNMEEPLNKYTTSKREYGVPKRERGTKSPPLLVLPKR